MLALEPCRVHICSKDIITELDNGFQQNTRHTGRPSRHPRSIPMRLMSSNWAHRHRSPASHAPTSGASVADVLPKGRLPRGDTSAHRTQSAVPPWQMFCRKEDYHERHLRSPHPVCRALVADVLPEGKISTGRHLRSPHPVCRASVADVLPEGKVTTGRHLQKRLRRGDISTGTSVPVGKVPRGGTSARPLCHAAEFCLKAIEGKRDPRRSLHYPPHHQTPAADETKT